MPSLPETGPFFQNSYLRKRLIHAKAEIMEQLHSRIIGGFYGLLVGDALGVPYEFKKVSEIPPREEIEFSPPPGYKRTYASIPVGTWSDDSAQALALLDSLLTCGRLDLNDLMERIAAWEREGRYAVDNNVFDIGITTDKALSHFGRGVPAHECGLKGEYDNGNGALMRVLPLALWHQGSDEQLVQDAMAQSVVTHGHLRSQVCCALYCLWARRLLQGDPHAWETATMSLRQIVEGTPYLFELNLQIRPDEFSRGAGSGYVVDSLWSARWAMQEDGYENVVKVAVALGNDTDTTACIAGAVAGTRDGIGAIPDRWLNALRGREIADNLLERLLERIG
jgi:ADP-ribosyl-[dinitrogen reductase] hydrolase